MSNAKYILIAIAAIVLSSCKKDLDINYAEVGPYYVIEGDITDEPAKVLITHTRSVNDSVKGKGLPGAAVTLSDDNGKSEQLVFGSDGYYRSPSGWKGETGRRYTLRVAIDGKEFLASSTMKEAAKLDSMQFVFLSSAGMKMMLLKYWHTYPKTDELSFIHARMFKNGKFYRSTMGKQFNTEVTKGQTLLGCTTEKKMDEDDPEDADVILHDNDKVHLELWTIDKSVYDYFFSLNVGKKNASNPITNISGGAMGYFSAHHVCTRDTIFFRKDVKE